MPVEISQYVYGNSLVNFAGGSAQSNVPFWMNQFAEAAGNTYSANGGYGFLRQYADRPEPADEWGFQGVAPLWDSESQPFDAVSFDTVLITPGNFLQDRDPDANYAGDSRSPLDATIETVRDTMAAQPDAQLFIYEGWADLAGNFGYPVSQNALQEYHAFNAGEYHDWFVDLTDQVNAAVPGADVQLIPVASVLAELFTDGPLEGLELSDLYVDSAPHGTETVYFLASMVTYPATFGEPLPAEFEVPEGVHPLVAENYELLSAQINEIVDGSVVTPDPDPMPEPEPEPTPEPEPEPEPNSDPRAVNDAGTLAQNEVLVLDLLANDSDADGDPLELLSLDGAQFGTLAIVDGQAVYTPAPGFTGSDTFTYRVSDGAGGISEGNVAVQVTAVEGLPDPEVTPEQDGFSALYFDVGTNVTTLDQVDFDGVPTTTGTVDALQYVDVTTPFVPGSGSDHFAVRYSGTIEVTEAGYHEIRMLADDEARLWVNDTEVLNTDDVPPGDLVSVWLDMEPGRYDIGIDYLEVVGEQSLSLDWRGPSTDENIVALTSVAGGPQDDVIVEPEPAEPELLPEPAEPEALPGEESLDAQSDFNAKAFATDAQSLKNVDFDAVPEAETVTKGVTLASEDGALIEGGPENGAVAFSKVLNISEAGLYNIELSADEQASVSISGLPVVSTDASGAGQVQSNSIFLVSGDHPVEVTYLDTEGAQSLDVTWSGPDTNGLNLALGDTPESALFSDAVAARAEEELTVMDLVEAEDEALAL